MYSIKYDQIYNFYRNNSSPDFSKTDDIIYRSYRASYKFNNNGKLIKFITPNQNFDIFYIKSLSEKHKQLCPYGLFVCTNADDRSKTLHFVYPQKVEDKLFGQHIHTFENVKKNRKDIGLHETKYFVGVLDKTVGNCIHDKCHQKDPLILSTNEYIDLALTSQSKCEMNEDIQRLFQDIAKYAHTKSNIIGGAKPPNKRNTLAPITFKSKKMLKIFKNWHTGNGRCGIQELHVWGIRQANGSYTYSLSGTPSTNQYIDIEKRDEYPAYAFEIAAGNSDETTIRKEVYKLASNPKFRRLLDDDF